MKLTLAELASQAILMETGQNLFDVTYMLLECIKEDEDVIQINNAEDVEKIVKIIIGIGLERCRSVSETKRYKEIFKVAIAGTESGFVFVAFCNA